jgi:cysteine desulfurase / selenocysteine lyase
MSHIIDIKKIRDDFPILKQKMRGKPLVYFDNGATSLKPKQVIESEMHFYSELGANIHRGIYQLSAQATDKYDQTREKLAKFINSPKSRQIIFTKGTTESINLVAYSWGMNNIKEGDEIVLSEMEHHSNLIPWQMVAQQKNAVLKFIPINKEDCTFDLSDIDNVITDKAKIVSITAMSNVTGVINPVKKIAEIAHKKGALMLIDGAQYVSHHSVDVQDLDCDFLAFSSHKMCGPTGVGILYGKEEILENMPPFMGGGDMILQVWKDRATYEKIPQKFEAGTPNIAGVIGLGKAIDYLSSIGMDNILKHEQAMIKYALERAQDVEGLNIYGTKDYTKKGGILSFNVGNVHSHDTGSILDGEGIAVRAGHHCCQPLMRFLGISGTTRASFYLYNTIEEIDRFIDGLGKVREVFGEF